MKRQFNSKKINKRWHPLFERLFYRRISNWLTPKVAKITSLANLISVMGFLLGIGGIAVIALGDYFLRIGGALILVFSYVIDCIDGELARGYNNQTKLGAFLDTSLDSTKESLIFFALAYSYYSETGRQEIFILLVLVLFLQRMLGRSVPLFEIIFGVDVPRIKVNFLQKNSQIVRTIAAFFSESYRSGTIWIVVLLGVVSNQILLTFCYFVLVLSALFLFLLFNAYKNNGRLND